MFGQEMLGRAWAGTKGGFNGIGTKISSVANAELYAEGTKSISNGMIAGGIYAGVGAAIGGAEADSGNTWQGMAKGAATGAVMGLPLQVAGKFYAKGLEEMGINPLLATSAKTYQSGAFSKGAAAYRRDVNQAGGLKNFMFPPKP